MSSIVGKLTQGAADAGFTYVTDVRGTKGQLKAVDLPANLQPNVAYGAGIVKGTPNTKESQAFIDDVISGSCSKVMQDRRVPSAAQRVRHRLARAGARLFPAALIVAACGGARLPGPAGHRDLHRRQPEAS